MPWLRYAFNDCQPPVFLDLHSHKEIDVGDDVALRHPVPCEFQQEVVAAGMEVACVLPEPDRIALGAAAADESLMSAERILYDRHQDPALIGEEPSAARENRTGL